MAHGQQNGSALLRSAMDWPHKEKPRCFLHAQRDRTACQDSGDLNAAIRRIDVPFFFLV